MKAWEMKVAESKKNLWLVTTNKQKFLCAKINDTFLVKANINLIIPNAYILNLEQL